MQLKFNDTDLAKKLAPGERFKIKDEGHRDSVKGLYASKTANVCTLMLRYWDKAAKETKYAEIGAYHPTERNVKKARDAALLLMTDVKVHKKDVAGDLKRKSVIEHSGTRTFDYVADLWVAYLREEVVIDNRARPRKENWVDDVCSLKRARAAFGRKQIVDVRDDEIFALITGVIKERKIEMARSIFSCLKRLFRWAGQPGTNRKFITTNPMSFITSEVLELPAANEKERCLNEDEIRTLWHGLDKCVEHNICDKRTARALKLILVTALRPSEVGLARRDEIGIIDINRGGDGLPAYRIPPARVKLRRVIVQPLSDLALEIINAQLAENDGHPVLFPYGGPRKSKVFGTQARLEANHLATMLRSEVRTYADGTTQTRVGICEFLGFDKPLEVIDGETNFNTPFSPFTPHDLRRTASTLLGLEFKRDAKGELVRGENGQPIRVTSEEDIDRILDHRAKPKTKGGGKTHKTYNKAEQMQHTMLRRPVLDHLAKLIKKVVGDTPKDNVVRIKRAA